MPAIKYHPAPPPVPPRLPPLHDGERLDQYTFHARYEAMPPGVRAELVHGVVHIMPSPVSSVHSLSHVLVSWWLVEFAMNSPGVSAHDNPTLLLGAGSEPQPDACLRLLPSHGGRASLDGLYLAGAPELVVEVSVSSGTHDLGDKKADYEQAGVSEYLVLVPEEDEAHWFALEGGRYHEMAAVDGILRSRVFPGLWLDTQALMSTDLPRLKAVTSQGLASLEHLSWVERTGRGSH